MYLGLPAEVWRRAVLELSNKSWRGGGGGLSPRGIWSALFSAVDYVQVVRVAGAGGVIKSGGHPATEVSA